MTLYNTKNILVLFIVMGISLGQQGAVQQLQDSIIQDIIDYSPFVLIHFHSPLKPKSVQFSSFYQELADQIKSRFPYKYFIGSVDCETQNDSCQQHQVSVYPTLKYFVYGDPYLYKGEVRKQAIIEWMQQKRKEYANGSKQQKDL